MKPNITVNKRVLSDYRFGLRGSYTGFFNKLFPILEQSSI